MRGDWCRLGLATALAATLGVGALASRADDESSAQASELSKDAQGALEGGLRYLADSDQRGADGSLKTPNTSSSLRLATTSLAGLAWLAAGSTPTRGPYRDEIVGALEYIVSQRERTSDVARAQPGYTYFANMPEEQPGRMHAYGFATLFLAEAYGMLGKKNERLAAEVRATLEGAVKLSVASQTVRRDGIGGWGYSFYGESRFAFGQDEASTTITQVQALRAAKNAGFSVPSHCITRAIKYVKKCVGDNGEAQYSLTMEDGKRTSFELTAAAVSTLNAAGMYGSDKKLESALEYLRRQMAKKDKPTAACEQYYFYGNLYAAQAMFQAGGGDWSTWWKGAQEDLVSKAQRGREGQCFWHDPREFGDAYATASACLILAIPMRYLPIFER